MKFNRLRRTLVLGGLGLALASALVTPSFAAEDLLQSIQKRGSIQVGLEGTYPPFNYQDENGQLTGFEVEFAKALADRLGVKAEYQTTKWDGLLAALESERLDVVINQVTISDARKKKYDFSAPYTVSGIQALTRKDLESEINGPSDLAGMKVGVGLGTNYETWLRENSPQAEVKTYDDDPTKYQDLRFGRIDAILIDRFAAFELLNKTGDALALSGAPFSRQEAGVALRKGNPELLAAIDQAIAKMREDGTLQKLSEKWFKADVTQ
ncbi:ABC-type amino acid transport/signal transduction systems, periplasmic component/domain [Hahella chejuensis KCTC 2396]|uniref:ABC-type amino acid transport/signal transduction systems, periplasmic component/domain n=1 Tax=Hahella chejuensis (strain KCTC 2396) TaxID=349521 RepID=Q2SFT9_HAHCH|nr:cystine ABC transporter substrate-binding protein [Hahella chejuensis]ABC30485.1 ABC-type amino acid transport/signal transduction systems, periplasmic component/domain [Hahella chejuensis KCTC 2396]